MRARVNKFLFVVIWGGGTFAMELQQGGWGAIVEGESARVVSVGD